VARIKHSKQTKHTLVHADRTHTQFSFTYVAEFTGCLKMYLGVCRTE